MNILVLDDDRVIRDSIKSILGPAHTIHTAENFNQAIDLINTKEFDAAIVDLDLRDKFHDGKEVLDRFKARFPGNPVIIESSAKDIPTVVECIKRGADDYIEKPLNAETLQLKVGKVIADSKKNRTLQRALEKTNLDNEIVGNHEKLLRAKEKVEKAGTLRMLFTGETGVGKTPFAWYSNQIVSRTQGQVRPFEHLNCASLSAEYFKDELFGHKKGAFTNAVTDKRGLVELANGGDLFLDEIGELPLEIQALFLTFLDNMEYYRLGDDQKRIADVRILCATNRDLQKKIKEGTFRKDLYSRIAQVEVHIPPLRERVTDIPILFEYFVNRFAGVPKPYDPELIKLFQKFQWEVGNVREIRDAVEYLVVTSRDSDRIEPKHLSDTYRPVDDSELATGDPENVSPAVVDSVLQFGLDEYLARVEKKILFAFLKQNTGTLEDLAKKLKTSKPTFYRRLKKFDIPLDE